MSRGLQTVQRELLLRGVASHMLGHVGRGFGGTRPLVPQSSSRNTRIEFQLVYDLSSSEAGSLFQQEKLLHVAMAMARSSGHVLRCARVACSAVS